MIHRAEVQKLRQRGHTLEYIARKFGRSITWVIGRLDGKYSVCRGNNANTEVYADENTEEGLLRAKGHTYQEIGQITGRSLTAVYLQLTKGKLETGKERRFRDNAVVPLLIKMGHSSIITELTIDFQRADVVSTTSEGRMCITEVKITTASHAVQTAIGQLVLYRMVYPEAELQIALPNSVALRGDIPKHLVNYGINVIFADFHEDPDFE
jgi:hypothetical protein